jgi:hypothetical protein
MERIGFFAFDDVETLTWTQPVQSGTAPPPRSYHSMCAYQNRIYVFGGAENDNSLYILNVGKIVAHYMYLLMS